MTRTTISMLLVLLFAGGGCANLSRSGWLEITRHRCQGAPPMVVADIYNGANQTTKICRVQAKLLNAENVIIADDHKEANDLRPGETRRLLFDFLTAPPREAWVRYAIDIQEVTWR